MSLCCYLAQQLSFHEDLNFLERSFSTKLQQLASAFTSACVSRISTDFKVQSCSNWQVPLQVPASQGFQETSRCKENELRYLNWDISGNFLTCVQNFIAHKSLIPETLYFAVYLVTHTFSSAQWILNFFLNADMVSRGGVEQPSGEDTSCICGTRGDWVAPDLDHGMEPM